MSAPLLALEGAELGYAGAPVLTGVDLAIRPGDFCAVTGPNGGGKSTLLRALLGALPPRAGRRAAMPGLRLGFVPQELDLDRELPLTAADVVAMGGWGRGGAALGAAAALAGVGLERLAGRRFAELSGGQKQRVLLARALAGGPQVLLLDEPVAGVDAEAARVIYDALSAHAAAGGAVVLVTHQPEAIAARAGFFARVGEGRVVRAPGARR